MRKYLLAAVAAAAITTPAVAQQSGPYAGIEGGILFPKTTSVDIDVEDEGGFDNAFGIDYKSGFDVDAIAGYDFGMFRVEAELGYKRAKLNELEINPALIDLIEDEIGEEIDIDDFEVDGKASVLSAMANGLVDFDMAGIGAYAGAGIGRARVKFSGDGESDSDSAWAYQLIAGVRAPVTTNVEVGLKYRYFRTGKLNFAQDLDFDGEDFTADASGRFQSHSLLASLIFNFGRPAAEPAYVAPVVTAPPAPVAPATQTCPDGSVIMATDTCPLIAPPPPPPSVGERG